MLIPKFQIYQELVGELLLAGATFFAFQISLQLNLCRVAS